MENPVGNVPPERFQNIGSVSGTQGGAVLFAPPSKSCRFSHPPSPCARSMAQRISLSADSDSGGSSPPENLPPAVLSWSSLTNFPCPDSLCFHTIRFVILRARVHRRLSTSFRQILLHTALKILAIRKYACKFLPCLQKNLLENPHIFPMNTSSKRLFRIKLQKPVSLRRTAAMGNRFFAAWNKS